MHRRADATLGGLIGIATDVSRLKEIERSLQKAKKELEAKVAERTQALESKNTQLEKQILKRKNFEKILNRERKLFIKGPVVVVRCAISKDGIPVEYMSPNIKQFGYEAKEFMSGNLQYSDIIISDHRSKVLSEIAKYSKSGVEHFEQNYSIKTKSGKEMHVHSYITIGRDENSKAIHLDGYLVDITGWKFTN